MYKFNNISKIFCFLLASCMAITVLSSCEEEKEKEEQVYFSIYVEVGAITKNSASCGVRVIAEPGSEVIYKSAWMVGCIWDDKGYPTHGTYNGRVESLGNSGLYSFQMTNLKPNTTYYVQGFIYGNRLSSGDRETVDGPVVSFRTPAE